MGTSTIRPVLVFGFATIFALWLLSAYDLVRRVTEVEGQAAAITSRFTDSEELLFTVRAQVFLSAIYAREAILDARPDVGRDYREQLRQTRSRIADGLQRYVPNVDSAIEREHWTLLEAELDAYWNSLSPLLTGQNAGALANTDAVLRREVIPKQETVVRISDEIRALNRDALEQQQVAVAALHGALRQRIWWTSGIAVGLAMAAAWFAARYAGRLESRVREQYVHEQYSKRELQRLSAELVHVQERERRTIARDLHDEIGQALLTVRLDLGTVERSGQLAGAPAQALSEARTTTDLAIGTVRDLSQLLHPPMLDDFGLVVTLDAHVRRFFDRTGVRTELVHDRMDERLPQDIELCAYRVVQEALTNVVKHAEARSCRVYLQRLPHSLLITIEDDGKGMDGDVMRREHPRGVGLVGVRERVSRLGGTVRVDSQPGRGTRVTAELPTTTLLQAPDAGDPVSPVAAGEPV